MIRVQPLEGTWQTLGGDLYPGVEPEGVSPTWGANGPESLSFSLQRPPATVHADLAPFTPVEWYPSNDATGDPLWSGYTMQAPPGGYGESTSVSCVGWHFYREDAPESRLFVHEDMSAWVDARSRPASNLAIFTAGWTITAGDGQIAFSYPGPHSGGVGVWTNGAVVLDLGPTNVARRVVVDWKKPASWASSATAYLLTGPDEITYATSTTLNTLSDATLSGQGAVTTADRFVQIRCDSNIAQDTARAFVVTGVRVFAETAYESGGVSVFTATMGIKALRTRLPLLSSDETQIDTTVYPITHAAWLREDATVRQMGDALNDYHGYRHGVDALRRVFFKAQPSTPRLQVNALAPGTSYRATSTNDGSDVYDFVSVRGRSGSGEDLRVDRWITDFLTTDTKPSALALTNPSFAVDASGWTNVTRVTSNFNTSPGAGSQTGIAVGSMTGGTFQAGVAYRLSYQVRIPAFSFADWRAQTHRVRFGSATDYAESVRVLENTTSVAFYQEFTVTWVPLTSVVSGSVSVTLFAFPYLIDTFTISEVSTGALMKRGRKRSFTLNVAAATDNVALDGLARAWLLAHRTVPHKAQLTVGADDAVTDLQAGQTVPMGDLGRYYGEMVRVLSVPDPDTGALQSRDGVIASVQGTGPVSLALDSERRSLEALMARMGVVQGSA